MSSPWVELIPPQSQVDVSGPGFSEYQWQALFACQIGVPIHHDWSSLKWGFNAATLFDEAMKRQNLFLGSQHGFNNELRIESPNRRTLAFRYINVPDEGLLLILLGKIYGRSKEDATESALAYFRELKGTFPYDYKLSAADSRNQFCRFSAWDIFDENVDFVDIVHIKRDETPILINQKSPFLQGFWQSSTRAHEQIWRSLVAMPNPVLVNITLRPTVIYENELQLLRNSIDEIAGLQIPSLNQKVLKVYKEWNENLVDRRQDPWQRFFYLQVHLVSTKKIDENLIRSVGASLTLNSERPSQPGYQVRHADSDEKEEWGRKIRNLDIVFSASHLPAPRLSEVADLNEVFDAIRIPYSPPGNDLLGIKYLPIMNE